MEIISLWSVLGLLAFVAVVDFLRTNLAADAKVGWRWPFLRDLPTIIRHFSTFHDFAVDVFTRCNTRVICLKLGQYNVFGVVDPVDVKHMLKDNWKNYEVSTGLRGHALKEVFGNGIFHADGDQWFMQRKHASREFSANIFRNHMTQKFIHYTNVLVEALAVAAKNGEVVDMHQQYFRLTLDSFGDVAFGVNLGGLAGAPIPFARAFDAAQELSARRVATKPPFVWKLQRALQVGDERKMTEHIKTINDFVVDLCEKRLKSPTRDERNDLLTKMIAVVEAESGGEPLTKTTAYLRDMTVNFMIAGRDTTACALSWFTYELTQHPEVEARLRAELSAVIGDRTPSFDDFADTHYLTACLSETLRLHPSVPFDLKTAHAADVLPSGAKVRAGDSVAYIPYAMARMKWLWGADACEFRPERWLDASGAFQREDPFKFAAFQAGPRLCLGVDMAMLEMKVVVAMILSRFTFEAVNTPRYRTGLVLQMDNEGFQVRVKPRGAY